MNIYNSILKRRTIRIFKDKKISSEILKKLINAARLAPSARNLQPLEFLAISNNILQEKVFENIIFGGETEKLRTDKNKPVAYILILVNKKVRKQGFEYDTGLAAGNIVLTAYEQGIGSCIIGAINREKLQKELNIPLFYYIDLVVALGYPEEKPKIKKGKKGIYKRNKKQDLLVYKKPLSQVLHWNKIKK